MYFPYISLSFGIIFKRALTRAKPAERSLLEMQGWVREVRRHQASGRTNYESILQILIKRGLTRRAQMRAPHPRSRADARSPQRSLAAAQSRLKIRADKIYLI